MNRAVELMDMVGLARRYADATLTNLTEGAVNVSALQCAVAAATLHRL